MSGVVDESNGDDSRALTAKIRARESIARIMLKAQKGRVRSACERTPARNNVRAAKSAPNLTRAEKIASSAPTEGALPLTRARSPRVALDGTATATMTAPVLPGEPLRHSDEVRSGPGTYVRGKSVMAAVMGHARTTPAADDADDKRPLVEVIKEPVVTGDATGRGGGTLLPEVGDEVFARVLRINPRQVWCEIVAVNGKAVNDASGFQGIVRQQDVRATEIDKVDMYESFLPADVIRAKVLSLGDQRSYYLTTARNELGVVQAKSPFTGEPMVPVSWQEMMCPSTQVKVSRKVAKVD